MGADDLHAVPAGVDVADATALLADGRTALALARDAAFTTRDRVVVTAAGGGVGSLLVQLAHHAGVASLIGLAGAPRKLDLAMRLGADAAVDYRHQGWVEALREATGGHGLDVVLDGVGGDTGSVLVGLMAPGGRHLGYGMASGSWSTIDEHAVEVRGLRVIDMITIVRGPQDNHALVEQPLAAAAGGRLRPTIGQTFALADAARAHAAIEARATVGKRLLIP